MGSRTAANSLATKDLGMSEIHSSASCSPTSASPSISSSVLLFSIPHNDDLEEALRVLDSAEWENAKPFLKPWGIQHVTPVHLAAYRGRLLIIQRAADLQADINALDNFKRGALHYAAAQGHVDVVKWLMERSTADGKPSERKTSAHPQLSVSDVFGNTALHAAIRSRRVDVVKFLVDVGSDVDFQNKESHTPLFLAGAILNRFENSEKSWYEKVIDILVSASSNFVNVADPITGITPLHHAVELNSYKSTKRLLEAGAKIVTCHSGSWDSPLHIAAKQGSYQLLSLLLLQRNSWNYKQFDVPNKLGWTPLYAAAHEGHLKCVRALIDNEASLAYDTNDGTTVIGALLKHGTRALALLTDILDAQIYTKDKTADVILEFRVLAPRGKLQMAVVVALITSIPTTKLIRILQHPLIEAFLQLKWSRFRYFYYILLAIQCIFIFFLTTYTMSLQLLEHDPLFLRLPLLVCACILLCHSLLQCFIISRYFGKQYGIVSSAMCEMISIAIAVAGEFITDANTNTTALSKDTADPSNSTDSPPSDTNCPPNNPQVPSWILQSAGIIIPLAFGKVILTISQYSKIGRYILMITTIMNNILKVLMILFVLTSGFTVIFIILSDDTAQFFNQWNAFMTTIIMMKMGNCETDDLTTAVAEEKSNTISIVFMMFVLFISIAIINLMIAVNDLQALVKSGYNDQLVGLAKLMIYCERLTSCRIFFCLKKFFSKSMIDTRIELEWVTVYDKCPRGISEQLLDRLFDLASKNSNIVEELDLRQYRPSTIKKMSSLRV